ncbi:LPP20 family lipoprotein [Pseudoalteromonas denitrificans]|nr:LPP20 family lipoprotein [Pseudoalteromonas denitrificans]
MKKPLIIICFILLLSGCANVFDKHIEYAYQEPDSYPILKAVGYAPISLQPGKNQQQKEILAIKASKLEAYRELAEQVYGQQITANASVRGMITTNDTLNSKVQGAVRGAKVIKSYAVGDSYATELELDMKLVHDLYIGQVKPRTVKKITYY